MMVAWEMAGACRVALLLYPLLGGGVPLLAWQGLDWLWLLLLALVCTVFAHAFHIHLLRRMSAYTANLAMNFEPIYGIALRRPAVRRAQASPPAVLRRPRYHPRRKPAPSLLPATTHQSAVMLRETRHAGHSRSGFRACA